MEKMTNVKALEYVLGMEGIPSEVVEKLQKMKASYEKKGSAERKPSANQIANKATCEAIVEFLADGQKYTISELIKKCAVLNEMSNQKVSALVKTLVDAKVVIREEDKRKAYFKLA